MGSFYRLQKIISGIIVLSFISSLVSAQQMDNSLLMKYGHSLSESWELDSQGKHGTFHVNTYKPVYILLANWSNSPNKLPTSENPDYTFQQPIALNATELKFQLSFKTKVIQGIIAKKYGDLWVAYTQSSRWQVYNKELSRPFRETNYEPEAMLTFATRYRVVGFNGRLLGVGFAHQSNGRSLPLSRSWNRVILQFGFEKENWIILFRPWFRLKDTEDENPKISDYLGRGELLISHSGKKSQLSLQARHSMRLGENNHGSLQFDWAIPISGNLKGHIQVFHGYGESMIDYNHNQTTVGVGISLVEWQ